jgi:hypothetical protein
MRLRSHCHESIRSHDITTDYTCTFQFNRSIADEIFCICQIQQKQIGVYRTAYQLFIDFLKLSFILDRNITQNFHCILHIQEIN